MVGDPGFPKLLGPRQDFKITYFNSNVFERGRHLRVCAGPFVLSATCCPDWRDATSLRDGVIHRLGRTLPESKREKIDAFLAFGREWIKTHIPQVPAQSEPSIDEWLDNSNYDTARKEQLRALAREFDYDRRRMREDRRFGKVAGHGKEETYGFVLKAPRGIYSRHDLSKLDYGPYVKLTESVVYDSPHFIKHVPVNDRPAYLAARFENSQYKLISTDYTSFESSFQPAILELEQFLLEHTLEKVEGSMQFTASYREHVLSPNKIRFKNFGCISTGRMSGETTTSLGNGITNLLLMLFVCGPESFVDGVVEGDDGLFLLKTIPDCQEFADLGFNLKLVPVLHPSEASFCGQKYVPDENIVLADPILVISKMVYFDYKYIHCADRKLRRLLRAKAMSFLSMHAGCPIIQPFCLRILELTKGYNIGKYQSIEWKWGVRPGSALTPKPISVNSRIWLEHHFGIPPCEQLRLEREIEQMELESFLDLSMHAPVNDYLDVVY